ILTRRFALELGQHGITVNAVAPGFVRTDLTRRGRAAADWPGREERFAGRAMMGRIGEPEDIANAVVFLASPESGWITAQVWTVGGWTTLGTVSSSTSQVPCNVQSRMVPSWVFLAERGRASLLLNFRTIQDLPPWTYRLPRWQAERAVIRGGGVIHVLPHELP